MYSAANDSAVSSEVLLDPFDPVATAGIRHALNAGGTDRPAFTWTENYAAFLTADAWLILATLSFWVAFLCVIVPRLRRRTASEANHRTRVISLTLLVLCIPGLWGSRVLSARAVVRKAEISLRLTPTQFGEPMSSVDEGDVDERASAGQMHGWWKDARSGSCCLPLPWASSS